MFRVALRKESVDRNVDPDVDTLTDDVALRKESVDRNTPDKFVRFAGLRSLSARRAWIEIVDMSDAWHRFASLSARRAWIEISCADSVSY